MKPGILGPRTLASRLEDADFARMDFLLPLTIEFRADFNDDHFQRTLSLIEVMHLFFSFINYMMG